MRIGIDGRPLQAALAGTGRYISELCCVLNRCFSQADFFVYSNRSITLPVSNDRWHLVRDLSPVYSRLPSSIWYLERVGYLAKENSIDVFWGGANFLPRGMDSCGRVLTVLDLVPELYPQTMGLKHRIAHKVYFSQSLRQADKLVTISQGSKSRLERVFGVVADEVVFPGVSERFRPPTEQEMNRVKRRYELQNPFFLAVATLEPRKNLEALLTALIQLKISGRVDIPALAIVGQVGWKAGALLKLIEEAIATGIKIHQTGYVPDEDLPALYGASSAFIFPSVYEGFGMPVLEALKCGANVLASDVPEIREAGGGYATYFEPSVEGIKQTLSQFLQSKAYPHPKPRLDHERITRLINHGSTWEVEGRKLATVIKSLS